MLAWISMTWKYGGLSAASFEQEPTVPAAFQIATSSFQTQPVFSPNHSCLWLVWGYSGGPYSEAARVVQPKVSQGRVHWPRQD